MIGIGIAFGLITALMVTIFVGLGIYLGWILANKKFNKVKKIMQEGLKQAITPEQLEKSKKEDEMFYKMKKEVQDARRKYKGNGASERIREENTRINESSDNSGSSGRKQLQDTPIEQHSPSNQAVELHKPTTL